MDYGGHNSIFVENLVMAYPYNYQQCFNFASFTQGIVGFGNHKPSTIKQQQEQPYNAGDALTRILQDIQHDLVVTLDQCTEKNSQKLSNNDYYTPSGKALFICRDSDYDGTESLHDMQRKYGLEIVSTTNSEVEMIQWAKSKLIH